ncbi:MAG: hypothetical protein KKH88_01405 [Nanoarchaeota archaeon]|nr:hypothetical protein [Nanoarchaeota archaeon]
MKVFSDRIITVNKNIEKSNRAKADLFELLITQGLIDYFRLQINYLKQITDLKTNLMNFPDGNKRIYEQENKAKNLLPNIIKLLKRKVKNQGKIKGIVWIGRNFVKTQSLADIKIDFNDKSALGISLKSVGVGTGTQKNVGYKTLKHYLGINLDEDLEKMWKQIKKGLSKLGGAYSKIATLSHSEIKKNKYRYKKIQTIGKEYGLQVQKKATNESVKKFNNLSLNGKLDFLKYLLGYNKKMELLTIIASKNNTISYSNEKYTPLVSGELKIEAKIIKDKSYCILINGTQALRLQSSFTNGVGISAFCQRAFLDKI